MSISQAIVIESVELECVMVIDFIDSSARSNPIKLNCQCGLFLTLPKAHTCNLFQHLLKCMLTQKLYLQILKVNEN